MTCYVGQVLCSRKKKNGQRLFLEVCVRVHGHTCGKDVHDEKTKMASQPGL